jgi:hypothetical protein
LQLTCVFEARVLNPSFRRSHQKGRAWGASFGQG